MKVRILGELTDTERLELLALIRAAGYDVSDEDPEKSCPEATTAADDGLSSPVADNLSDQPGECDEVAIVVLHPGRGNNAQFAEAMRQAASRGCRVVGVWPPGSSGGAMPSAFEDYGSGVATWEPGVLQGAIDGGSGADAWLDAAGEQRPVQVMKRNRCR